MITINEKEKGPEQCAGCNHYRVTVDEDTGFCRECVRDSNDAWERDMSSGKILAPDVIVPPARKEISMLRIDNLAPESDTIIVTSENTITTISRDEDGCIHVAVVHNHIGESHTGLPMNPRQVTHTEERHLVLGIEGDLT